MTSSPPPASSPSPRSPPPNRASRSGTTGGHRRGRTPESSSSSPLPRPSGPMSIPEKLWSLQVPLIITHSSLPNTPFVAAVPRFSYLALLLPRLTAYFGAPCSSFHHEEIQLRNLPVGLLLDLYQPAALPWRLVVGDGPEWDIGDTFLNGAKEADFVRNNNAQQIMSLSKADTTSLWNSVRDNDYSAFVKVNSRLLNPPTPLKSVPMRIYIPSSPPGAGDATPGAFRVMQTLVPPRLPNGRTPQTLGPALRMLLPSLFPNSRDPVLATAVLHGAPAPLSAPLEELMREAAYPDGWLCFIVVLL